MCNKKFCSFFLSLLFVACGGGGKDRTDNFNGGNNQPQNTPPRQSFIVRTNLQTGLAEYTMANFDKDTHPQQLSDLAEGNQNWRPISQNQMITDNSRPKSNQLYFIRNPQAYNSQNVLPQIPGGGGSGGPGYTMPGGGGGYGQGGNPSQLPYYPGGGGYGQGGSPSQLPYYPGGGGGYGRGGGVDPGYGVPVNGGGYPPNYGGGYPPGGGGYGGGYYPYCGAAAYSNCYGYLPAAYYNTAWMYWSPCYYYPTANYGYSFYAYAW